jgi:hypothetical protein
LPADERVLVVGFRLEIGEKNMGTGPVSAQHAAGSSGKVDQKKGTGPISAQHPPGRSGKLDLSPFSASGMARLCIPCRAVEREAANAGGKDATSPACMRHPPGRSGKLDPSHFSELSVSWATTEITAGQLAGLRPGDIIATETAADGPVVVSLDGEPKFLAKPLAWGGHRAVRITGAAD